VLNWRKLGKKKVFYKKNSSFFPLLIRQNQRQKTNLKLDVSITPSLAFISILVIEFSK
jgi:hypothetical protein